MSTIISNISLIEYLLYFLSILSISFWIIIWVMHICALTNAKLKLNKRSYTSAASKRKRKLKHLKEKYLPSLIIFNNNNNSIVNSNDSKTTGKNKSFSHIICCDNNDDNNNLILNNNINNNYNSSLEATLNINLIDTTTTAPLIAKNENHLEVEPLANEEFFKTSNRIDNKHNYYQQKYYDQSNNSFSYINLPLPGVSIIKPLVGVDSNLHNNLETFFHMDYPTYELLFCVQDPDDAAILIVKNLFKLYANIDAKLFIGGSYVGVNPKINNMQPAYEAAKYELVLISDSGISMKKDTLLDMVGHMREDVALVHQMPFVCDGREGFQSVFEKVYFGTAHARAYLTADLLNINCPTGMSALMRKYLLDEVGGIKAFGQYLAEDFFFAKSFTDRGWKISISSQPAWQNSANSSDTLSTLNARIQRWIKLRFAMVPQWTLLEPFSECMLLGLLGAMSLSFLLALDPFATFLFHVLLWFLFDYKLLCTVQNGPLTFSKTDFIIAWLVRECTALLVFFKALTSPKVTWRSRIFKLKWGGYAEEIIT